MLVSVTFTKLFSSITESTIWAEPDHTRIVWITMLAMADRFGRVWASIPGLANRARVSVEACEEALETLLGPDRYSRTKDNDGRRIEPIEGGWRLLNHEKYRAIRDEEAIKESKRKYINGRRAVERANLQSNTVDLGRHNAEADTDAFLCDAALHRTGEVSPVPSSALPVVSTKPPTEPRSGKVAQKRAPKPAASAEVWDFYSKAYALKYGTDPVRNAKINAQMAQLVARLGADAPFVAGHYLKHQNALYVRATHPVDLLLRDAESLRTAWITGNQVTQTQASQADKTQTNVNVFGPMLAEARAREAKDKLDAQRTTD